MFEPSYNATWLYFYIVVWGDADVCSSRILHTNIDMNCDKHTVIEFIYLGPCRDTDVCSAMILHTNIDMYYHNHIAAKLTPILRFCQYIDKNLGLWWNGNVCSYRILWCAIKNNIVSSSHLCLVSCEHLILCNNELLSYTECYAQIKIYPMVTIISFGYAVILLWFGHCHIQLCGECLTAGKITLLMIPLYRHN